MRQKSTPLTFHIYFLLLAGNFLFYSIQEKNLLFFPFASHCLATSEASSTTGSDKTDLQDKGRQSRDDRTVKKQLPHLACTCTAGEEMTSKPYLNFFLSYHYHTTSGLNFFFLITSSDKLIICLFKSWKSFFNWGKVLILMLNNISFLYEDRQVQDITISVPQLCGW